MSSEQGNLFVFSPNFEKVESFLSTYQKLDNQKTDQVIVLEVRKDYWTTNSTYPDIEANCWRTLNFAVDEMDNAFFRGKSKVQIKVKCTELEK